MNMFNTDSGFRPPSPLTFSAPAQGLFGDNLAFEDFRFSNPDFLNIPTSPSPSLTADPSLQLFNPSEQRYFSEFLDTLVVDQDFTFDPSSIPNLPTMNLFAQEGMPGGFMDSSFGLPPPPGPINTSNNNQGMMNSMDFDMTSPSSQTSFGGAPSSLPNHFGRGGFPTSPLGESPLSPGSPASLQYTVSAPVAVPAAKRRTTHKSKDMASSTPARKGTSSRPTSLDAQDSVKISTPIQQLSKLSLNSNSNSTTANNDSTSTASAIGSSSKKNKRQDDSEEAQSSVQQQQQIKEESRERDASVSDEYASDAAAATCGSLANGANGASSSLTTKRKPYKELLTEEEKRANHIASEQKRRNTIRNGFKDMVEIIPDLKDVNSSKSTILFKAVDFIQYLEKRNRRLEEKASRLEARLMGQRGGSAGGGNGSGLDDQRLQDIPHFLPVSFSGR